MNFEDAGRTLDQELAKVLKYFNRDVKPTARRDMVKLLRNTALRLEKLAASLEKSKR